MTDPSDNTTMEFKFHQRKGRRGRRILQSVGKESPSPSAPIADFSGAGAGAGAGRKPRVARLMALAVRFDQLIAEGKIKDYAELSRVGRVTRARISQIMNMLALAPDIQEALLNLPLVTRGRDPINERNLRLIATEPDWVRQRQLFQARMPIHEMISEPCPSFDGLQPMISSSLGK